VTNATPQAPRHSPSARRAFGVLAVLCLMVCAADLSSAGASPAAPRSAPRTVKDQHGWTPVTFNHGVIAVDRRAFAEPDGHTVTLYRFIAGQVRFALHTGSLDPPEVARYVGPGGAPRISRLEAPHIVAAFNGGFMVATGSGGFELNRHVYVALQGGTESLVINADGTAKVGAWGHALPLRGEAVVAVRQNLQALISGGRLSPLVGYVDAWGATENGVAVEPRSSLGIDRHGNLVYAASMASLPVDLGVALMSVGVVQAMELDINPGWVQLDSTPHPGGRLVAGIPSQTLPGNQYELGWTRDFVTVMAAG